MSHKHFMEKGNKEYMGFIFSGCFGLGGGMNYGRIIGINVIVGFIQLLATYKNQT